MSDTKLRELERQVAAGDESQAPRLAALRAQARRPDPDAVHGHPQIVDRLLVLGGARCNVGGDHDRVYMDDLERWSGLEVSRYGTGNISHARLDGVRLSNTRARKLLARLDSGKLYYDVNAGAWGWRDLSADTARGLVDRIRETVDRMEHDV